jgi:glutathione S-transferase
MEYFAAAGGADLINKHKNVAAWWNRISSRPSWKKAAGK